MINGTTLNTNLTLLELLQEVNKGNYEEFRAFFPSNSYTLDLSTIDKEIKIDLLRLCIALQGTNIFSIINLDTDQLKPLIKIIEDLKGPSPQPIEEGKTTISSTSLWNLVNATTNIKLFQEVNKGNYDEFRTFLAREQYKKLNLTSLAKDVDVEHLSKALQGTYITSLNLSNNAINDDQIACFCKNLKETTITSLSLNNNQIGNEGAAAIGQCLSKTVIQYLDLDNNDIDDAGIADLSAHLKDSQVVSLKLSQNSFGDNGFISLAQNLKNTKVKILCLDNNPISDIAAAALGECLQHTNISSLSLTQCHISDNGIIELTKHLKNADLSELYLENNNITDAGAAALCQHLKGTEIRKLELGKTNLSDNGIESLIELILDSTLLKLYLGGRLGEVHRLFFNQLLEKNHQKYILGPYALAKLTCIEIEEKSKYFQIPLIENENTHQEKIQYAAGIYANLQPEMQAYISQYLSVEENQNLAFAAQCFQEQSPDQALTMSVLTKTVPFKDKLAFGGGILMKLDDYGQTDVQTKILSYLPLMNAKKAYQHLQMAKMNHTHALMERANKTNAI